MTDMEKFRMYQGKYRFIQKVDLILTTPTPKGFTTESIDYELWEREFEGLKSYQEVIVITFKGGGQLPFSFHPFAGAPQLMRRVCRLAHTSP